MRLDVEQVGAVLDTVLRAVHALGTDTPPEAVICEGVSRFLPADRCLYLEFDHARIEVIWPLSRPPELDVELDLVVALAAARTPAHEGSLPPVQVRSLDCAPRGQRIHPARESTDVIEVPLGGRSQTSSSLLAVRAQPFTEAEVAVLMFAQTSLHELDRLRRRVVRVHPLRQLASRAGLAADMRLTPRELEVLRLLALGLPARSIAFRIETSPRTVHKHLGSIYRKLTVHDRLGAVNRAYELGLLQLRDRAARFGDGGPRREVTSTTHGSITLVRPLR